MQGFLLLLTMHLREVGTTLQSKESSEAVQEKKWRGSGGRNKPHHPMDAGFVVETIILLKCVDLKMVIMTAICGRIR